MVNGTGLWLPPSYQREMSVEEKAASLEEINRANSAVTAAVPTTAFPVSTMLLFSLAQAGDEFGAWGSNPVLRDRQLRAFFPSEPFLASSIATIAARNAAMNWKITGAEQTAKIGAGILQNANFGAGWEHFISTVTIDLLSQDKGAFVETPRAADSPDAPVLAINHLDAGRCHPTGVPETPVIYEDANNVLHLLKWYEVVQLLEMPSPQTFNRLGFFYRLQYSSITRLLRAAQIIKSIGVYNEEKITGRFQRGIHLLTGVTAEEVRTALTRADFLADQAGLTRYMQPAMVGSVDPKADVKAVTLDLASLPAGWDEEKSYKWYLTAISMALLTDYGELAPLPGGNLGTAAQSETMHLKSRGKGQGLFQQLIARLVNMHGVLPANVEFGWDEPDEEAAKVVAETRKTRAEERKLRIESGEINDEVAQRRALAEGDLTQEEYAVLESARAEQARLAAAALPNGVQNEDTVEGEERTGPGAPRSSRLPSGAVEGEERTDERGLRTVSGSRAASGVPFGTLITSRLHRAYSTTADDASTLGYFPVLADRLAVANAIGPALTLFEELLREAGVWDIEIAADDADRVLAAAAKALAETAPSEERAGPDTERLDFEDEVADAIENGLARVRRELDERLHALVE